jgi:glycosidase
MNHTSTQHPWFVKGKRGPQNDTHGFYLFRDEPLDWGQPWNAKSQTWHRIGPRYFYGLFWGGMPDLNYGNAQVRKEMLGIGEWWLRQGVDGFRLDAARYLHENGKGRQADQPETHAFWRRLRSVAEQVSSDSVLIGEVWTDLRRTVTYFGSDDELHMLFGFDRAAALRRGLSEGSTGGLQKSLCAELEHRPKRGWFGSFATNHDMDRLATRLGSLVSSDRLSLFAKLLFTLPGTPFIYYGQELGLRNGPGTGDPEKRMPMRWAEGHLAGFTSGDTAWATDDKNNDIKPVAAQLGNSDSLLATYRRLIDLRQSIPALRRGHTWVLDLDGRVDLLAYARVLKDDIVLVIANASNKPASVRLPLERLGWGDVPFNPIVGTEPSPDEVLQLEPAGFLAWRARVPN